MASDRAKTLINVASSRLAMPKITKAPRIDTPGFKRYVNIYLRKADELAIQLAEGDVSIDEWLTSMKIEVEKLHLTGHLVGRGGLGDISSADFKAIAETVAQENEFLDQWADQMKADGVPSLNGIKSRSRKYLGHANTTIQQATIMRLGIPRLPAYPGDGHTDCKMGCKCRWEIKSVNGGFNLYWRLGKAEHCTGCKQRAATYNPLKVRDGVFYD